MLLVFFFFYLYGDHRDLPVLTHSFPTLRSSDLVGRAPERAVGGPGGDGDRAARDRAHDDGRRLQNDDRQRAPDAKTVDPAPQRLFVAERRQRARFGQSPIDPDQHQQDRRADPDLGLRYRRVRRLRRTSQLATGGALFSGSATDRKNTRSD